MDDQDLHSKIEKARILVVGAGGIGCEVLKNLVLSGFRYIKVIDLDTIEMSNLNRQFLFRKEHIGQSKALVAAKAASVFGNNVNIEAEQENIMHPKYDVFFYKTFDVIINALDNVKARQYVNTMCVLADVPLIEGGSTGLLGQSYPIIPHETECYNCRPRGGNEGEQYAVCTIRSTPEKLEHCIVWSKELFVLLFGKREDSLLYEEVDSVYMGSLTPENESIFADPKRCLEFAIDLMESIFDKEIEKRVMMDSYKTLDKQPHQINIRQFIDREGIEQNRYFKQSENYEELWDVKSSVNILASWIWKYAQQGFFASLRTFNKDNHGDVVIVTAATNISFVFSILKLLNDTFVVVHFTFLLPPFFPSKKSREISFLLSLVPMQS